MHIPLRQNKGITLIELLVSLAIAGILVAGVYRTFMGQQRTYTAQEQVVDMQQNVRAGINRMMREIRMAGFGNVSMLLPVPGVKIGVKTYTDVVNPDYPVAGSVTILSAMGSTILTATPAANQITVKSLTDSQGNTLFDTGDRKYVSIGGVESGTITNIAGTTLTLNGNLTYSHLARMDHLDADGNPVDVNGNPVIVSVFAIRAISYQVDGTKTLLRNENMGAGGQALADNIENLQFVYLDAKGNPPAKNADIRVVQVTLKARTNDSDPQYKTDGGYRKRVIVSNVHLKNMGLEL
jgi:prepilin-type N-terminal cleavage/methylation domain-containing protein